MQGNRFTLGLVANSKRSIRSGSEYNKYFLGGVEGKEITLVPNGSVSDTVEQMKKIVKATLAQTKNIAPVLKGSSRLETARNLWNFLYGHVQYTKDNPLREQLRTPARTWQDRARGVDCDCYAIFISSVLTNLGIPHFFRIAAYNGGDFQHVYVVVPDGKEIIIDPVLNTFNSEHPYSKKKDFNMRVTMLSGVSALGACATNNSTTPTNPQLPAKTAEQLTEPVQFAPIEFLTVGPQVNSPQSTAVQSTVDSGQSTELQASAKAAETKVMWGLGLSALALLVAGAFSKKKSLSGVPGAQRKWLSTVQL